VLLVNVFVLRRETSTKYSRSKQKVKFHDIQ
jgi:hypothetical protein